MTTKSLLRPKDKGDQSRHSKNADPDRLGRGDFRVRDSEADIWDNELESAESMFYKIDTNALVLNTLNT